MKGLLLGVIIASGILSGGCSNGAQTTTKVDNVEDVTALQLIDYVNNEYIVHNFGVEDVEGNIVTQTNGDVMDCTVMYRNVINGTDNYHDTSNYIDGAVIQYEVNLKEDTITVDKMVLFDEEYDEVKRMDFFRTPKEVGVALTKVNDEYKVTGEANLEEFKNILKAE